VRLPYAQADFPEDSFKTAIGGAVFGGGPEEDIANRLLVKKFYTSQVLCRV